MSSFLQPISVVYVTDCIMDGQSGAQNIMVHPGCQMWMFHKATLTTSSASSTSWELRGGVEYSSSNTRMIQKESNPDNLRGVQILVSSQPYVSSEGWASFYTFFMYSEVLPLSLRASALRGQESLRSQLARLCVPWEQGAHGCLFKASAQLLAPGRFILWKSGWMDKWTNKWILYLV